jgi:cyclophilin family peptidyl-prolyl cis-trans isomerase
MLRFRFAPSALACSMLMCLACTPAPQTCSACGYLTWTDGSSGSETDATEADATETDATETDATETDATETETGDPIDVGACMSDTPIVVLETSMGVMVVQLDAVRAPVTVENFINYVVMEFYDGTIFHRVINGFVVQGGGFEPGLMLKPTLGTIPLEIHPELRHVDGAIAMARSDAPDTAESQFYITDAPQPGLDDDYAVFGVLIDGFPVRDAISSVSVDANGVPATDVILESAYCVESWPL